MNNHQQFLEPEQPRPRFKSLRAWLAVLAIPLRLLPEFLLWLGIGALVLLVVLAFMSLPYAAAGKLIMAQSLDGKKHLEIAEQQLASQDFMAAAASLEDASASFYRAEQELEELAGKPLLKLPGIRSQAVIADDILTIGRNLSQSLAQVAGFAGDVMLIAGQDDLNLEKISEQQRVQILARLVKLGQELDSAKQSIEQTQLAWQRLSRQPNLFLWRPVMGPLQEKLPVVFKTFEQLILAADLLPELAGYPEQKNYLLLMQNNDELRPGGGFIGTYGIIKVLNADLVSVVTDNIYNLDRRAIGRMSTVPPAPLRDSLTIDAWYMRDANWWPDFPASAQQVEELYHLEAAPGEDIHGVVGINQDFIEDLLTLVGPITAGGVKFTAENFTRELQYQVEQGYYQQGIPEYQRKDIIGDLAKQLQTRIFSLSMQELPLLLNIVRDNLDRKHILLYFKNPAAQSYLADKQWAGQVSLTKDDYLMVVDANLAAMKTDAVMERTVNYTLTPANGDYQARAEIIYAHTGGFEQFITRYRSYTRVYVPRGSELAAVTLGQENIELSRINFSEEFDKTVWGLFFTVEPGQSKRIIFEYKLPKQITDAAKDGDYKLLIQKQPGVRWLDLNLDLTFPESVRLFSSDQDTKQVKYSEKIVKDQLYTVLFR